MCAAVLVYLSSWSHNYVANVCVDVVVTPWGRGRSENISRGLAWHELNRGLVKLGHLLDQWLLQPFSCFIHRMHRAVSRRMVTSADGAGGRELPLPC